MKAFREERKTMHTKRAARWVSSVAVLAATALGLGAPLATPAAAAGPANLTATAAQPRYPVGQTAQINVTATNGAAGDSLSLTVVSGPDHSGGSLSCATTLSAAGTATCTLPNFGGAGTDSFIVTDSTSGGSSAPSTVSFETISATADQNVASPGTLYLYGTSETATVNVTFTGASTTPNLKALATNGPDKGQLFNCGQSPTQPANWSCAIINGGTPGADTIQLFDDGSAHGTVNQADSDEAKTSIVINFERVTATPLFSRTDTSPAGQASFSVQVSGNPAGWDPQIKEIVTNAQFSSAGTCTPTNAPTDTLWTCTVVNNGRPDAVTVQIFDDLNSNGSPSTTEPSATSTAYFEVLSAQDTATGHTGGSTATITVTVSGTPAGQTPSIDYTTLAGDPDPHTTAVVCPASGTNTFTCSIKNGATVGTDHLTIFDDANNNGTRQAGEPTTTIDVTFGDSIVATPRATQFPVKDANNSGSGIAPIDVTVTGAAGKTPNVRYRVTSSTPAPGDADTGTNSHPCDATGDPSVWVCNVLNTSGQPVTDGVLIYNDPDSAGPPGVKSTTVSVTFVRPASITMTPKLAPGQGQPQIAVGGCQPYVVNVAPGLKFPVRITATQDVGSGGTAPPSGLTACSVPGGSAFTSSHPGTNPSGGSAGFPPVIPAKDWFDILFIDASTAQDPAHPGQIIVGISSSHAGTVSVTAATNLATGPNPATTAQNLSVVTPGPPHTVTVTPTSRTIVAGSSASFSVLVQDSSATPLPGAAVSYVIAPGDPDATTKAISCATADQFGNSNCTIANNRNVGVDHVTFFAPQTSGETAPAANDPQATGTITVHALPPAGSHLTFGCPDELVSNANQITSACTVTTGNGGARQIIFAAHISDASGAPVANIPVSFTLVNSPAGSTATAAEVNTNAKGNALYVVNVPAPAAGNKVTVSAVVGDPANGGLGPQTAVATFQSPHPAAVTVTPHSQKVAAGGTATLTARVTDQFGVGVAGQSLSWAVSGRNSDSGPATTNANGTATFSYLDTGTSGSDTVSVLDVSGDAPTTNNPGTAVVTFGSGGGGCTSNCGTGQKESPTLKVTQKPAGSREKLTLTVTSHPKLVGAKVVFYSVSKSGARHNIGHVTTNARGKAVGTLKASHGQHLRFQAKVVGKAGVKSGFTPVVKVHVL